MTYLDELASTTGLSPFWTLLVGAPVWILGMIRVYERLRGRTPLERQYNRMLSRAGRSASKADFDGWMDRADRIAATRRPPPLHPRPGVVGAATDGGAVTFTTP